ncbi:MAG: M20/M25/M40 family metallo-hydrolase [Halodesulfurarchaeum sp.]
MSVDPIEFLESAVETPSHESVDEMRELLVDTLQEAGLDPQVDELGNVLAERGAGNPHIVLNTHLDTVPPHHPLERTENEIRGRGSCDAKGPLAAMLAAFLAVDPSRGRVTLVVTPDEERASTGAAALDLAADGFIVGEPTGLAVCIGARGRFQGTVSLHGKGAHAADPDAGVNAISGLRAVLEGMETYDTERGIDAHPRLGAPTLTPTLVSGGEAGNRIPAAVEVTFDRRTVPPETESAFFEAFESHLAERVSKDLEVTVSRAERDTPFLSGFETDPDSAVSLALLEAGAGDARPFGAATEAAYFADIAPTVVFGPGDLSDEEGPVAHSEREYVRMKDVRRAVDILTEALTDLVC